MVYLPTQLEVLRSELTEMRRTSARSELVSSSTLSTPMASEVLRGGYLFKQGGLNSSFRRRYFWLTRAELLWFDSARASAIRGLAKGSVLLRGARLEAIGSGSSSSGRFRFTVTARTTTETSQLSSTGRRLSSTARGEDAQVFILEADSAALRDGWLAALRIAVMAHQ